MVMMILKIHKGNTLNGNNGSRPNLYGQAFLCTALTLDVPEISWMLMGLSGWIRVRVIHDSFRQSCRHVEKWPDDHTKKVSKNQACNSAICFSQPRISATFGAQFLCGWSSKFQEEISLARSHTDFAAAANCKSFLVFIVLAPRLALPPFTTLS